MAMIVSHGNEVCLQWMSMTGLIVIFVDRTHLVGEYRILKNNLIINCFPNPVMPYVLWASLHKNNASYLLSGLYHASVNWISIVLMQITPQMNCIMGFANILNEKLIRYMSTPNRPYSRWPPC